MTIPDDLLMAFADGELDESTRRMVEAAERDDPEVRRRVAQHRQLRDQLQTAFAASLAEPVPERLLAAARRSPTESAPVTPLDQRRAAKTQAATSRFAALRWQSWGSLAASLLLGLGLGYIAWHGSEPLLTTAADGGVMASGSLAQALSQQLSAQRAPARLATIGLSFRAKSGEYCRTFSLASTAAPSGLACRAPDGWRVRLLTPSSPDANGGSEYRMAGSDDSPQLRSMIESEMQGEPLTQDGEDAARRTGWAAQPSP